MEAQSQVEEFRATLSEANWTSSERARPGLAVGETAEALIADLGSSSGKVTVPELEAVTQRRLPATICPAPD